MENAFSVVTTELPGNCEPTEDPLKGLREYHRLLEKSQKFSYLLERTEECRKMVPPAIYQQVREDYNARKAEVDKVVEQERQACIGVYREKFSQKEKLQAAYQGLSDRLKELKFRYLLGEYVEEEIEEECNNLRRQLMEYTQRLNWLEEVLNLYVHTFGLDNLISERNDRERVREPLVEESFQGGNGGDGQGSLSAEPALEAAPAPAADVEPGEAQVGADPPGGDGLPEQGSTEQKAPSTYVRGHLVLLEGGRKGDRFPMIAGDVNLGSASGNDVVLSELGVAKSHARVLYKDRTYVLENQDVLGRTYVNGIQSKSAELHDGDVIRLGEVKMRVELA